ncbi:hypothetical protein AA0498_0022 [Acidomonas methanolica]|nr:hypothetical protein AA0498_0022 [Acidomonas methanolica]
MRADRAVDRPQRQEGGQQVGRQNGDGPGQHQMARARRVGSGHGPARQAEAGGGKKTKAGEASHMSKSLHIGQTAPDSSGETRKAARTARLDCHDYDTAGARNST